MSNARRGGRFVRYGSLTVLGLLLVLQGLSVPFYTGSGGSVGVAHMMWRLEHGRLRISCSEASNAESFYVAINNEGLRWGFEGSYDSVRHWTAIVPLWALMIPAAGVSVWAWRRSAERAVLPARVVGSVRVPPVVSPPPVRPGPS
jgi:hypothetical protein